MDSLIDVASKLGVPTAFAAMFAYAIYRALRWIGTEIGKPLVVRHITFLDKLEASVTNHADKLDSISASQERIAQRLDKACQYPKIHDPDRGA